MRQVRREGGARRARASGRRHQVTKRIVKLHFTML